MTHFYFHFLFLYSYPIFKLIQKKKKHTNPKRNIWLIFSFTFFPISLTSFLSFDLFPLFSNHLFWSFPRRCYTYHNLHKQTSPHCVVKRLKQRSGAVPPYSKKSLLRVANKTQNKYISEVGSDIKSQVSVSAQKVVSPTDWELKWVFFSFACLFDLCVYVIGLEFRVYWVVLFWVRLLTDVFLTCGVFRCFLSLTFGSFFN